MMTQRWEVTCVIYDCDGVLFDSLEANGRLYNDLCASVGRGPLEEDEIDYVHCHTVYQAIHHIFGMDGNLEKKALELLKEVDLKKYIVYLKMEPHLLETLGALRERGLLRAISTNRTTSMPHIMDRFGLGPYFDMVVTALDVANPKPHPESLEKIMKAFTLDREEAVFVGDSEVDQKTAEVAHIKFVAYKNRELPSDGFIEDHLKLLSLIDASRGYSIPRKMNHER
jgi:phosphoglycolate phosphatase